MREPFDQSKVGLPPVPAEWNGMTSRIIEAGMEVHTERGPGLLEGVYEDAPLPRVHPAGNRVSAATLISDHVQGESFATTALRSAS